MNMKSLSKQILLAFMSAACAVSTFADGCSDGEVWINREHITCDARSRFDGDFMHFYVQSGASLNMDLQGIIGSCDHSQITVWVKNLPSGLTFNENTFQISGTVTAGTGDYMARIYAQNWYEKEYEDIFFHVSANSTVDDNPPTVAVPRLDQLNFTFETYMGFGVAGEYEIRNLQGGKVSLKKVGKSKLPSGVKLKYDKKTGRIVLSGAPKRAGTFEYVIRIDEKVGRETIQGAETTFRFDVKDMSKLSPSDPNYNSAAGKKISTVIPLHSEEEDRLAGLLTVSISAKNVVTAKFKGDSSKTLSFKGSWQNVDAGELSVFMMTKTGMGLTIWMSKEGILSAYLGNVKEDYGIVYTACGVDALAKNFSEYEGTRIVYTPDGEMVELKINKQGKVTYKSSTDKTLKGKAQIIFADCSDGDILAQVCLARKSNKYFDACLINLDQDDCDSCTDISMAVLGKSAECP